MLSVFFGSTVRSPAIDEALALDAGLRDRIQAALGELYESKGARENAAKYYEQFVELWKNADPELQPAVKEVRARLAKLRSAEPVKR